MGIRCKPEEANVNVCRQIGLRGADRREMASTCYIAGLPALSTPQLRDTNTHTHVNLHGSVYLCGCLPVSSALSFVLCSWRPAEGRMSSLLLASCPPIFDPTSHANVSYPTLPSFVFLFVAPSRSLSQQFVLFIASLILYVSYVSSSTSLVLISLHREKTPAPSILSLSLTHSLTYMPVVYLSPSKG